ncbi:MAG: amine oxidase [Gemmatimonadetes bacterium]|nr:amine oxidase [Gemmatimonadota bacterium]
MPMPRKRRMLGSPTVSDPVLHDVVIAGAGPAGLAAAAALRGYDVLILERETHEGGRVATIERAGMRIDLGACFAFRPELLPIEVRGRIPRLIEERDPIELRFEARRAREDTPLECVEAIVPENTEAIRRFGQTGHLGALGASSPVLHALFSTIHPGRIDDYDAARRRDALAHWHPHHWESGNGLLTASLRMASDATLVCDAEVTSIDERGERVRVSFRQGQNTSIADARVLIIATPADVALGLTQGGLDTPARRVLERTRYGRYTVVAFAIEDARCVARFRFLYDVGAPTMSFAMQQRSADRTRAALLCYFNDEGTAALDGIDDAGVIEQARWSLINADVAPEHAFAHAHVDLRRWRIGGTILSSELLSAARSASPRVGARVVLAGDYIAMTEGWGYGLHDAVTSGNRAAAIARDILAGA